MFISLLECSEFSGKAFFSRSQ